ncbi:MAG: class I tRNA ligase family protein [Myxococcaceae bacterium]|nr:class I tRNA ligase family protein [Myxococcaceae bacterium]
MKAAITADLEKDGRGKKRVEYKLRDWVFSRQRYWGEPFPIYFPVETEGDPRKDPHVIRYDRPIAVAESELPVRLPETDDFQPGDDPAGVLARLADWRFFQKDGQWFARETNTMPQWAGSCWYYLRYLDAKNETKAWDPELEKYWMPVDLYVGGVEHAVLHLLYARFWHKVLFDCGLVSTKEPFQKLFNQGMILAYSFQDERGKYYSPGDIDDREDGSFVKATGEKVKKQIEKMSKSRFNVVSPDDVIRDYGADTLRLYELFMGPLEQVKPWEMKNVQGCLRFLERVWRLVVDVETGAPTAKLSDAPADTEPELNKALHKCIQLVERDTLAMRFNTAISHMMTFANEATGAKTLPRAIARTFMTVLAPYAPHLAEELWSRLGGEGLVSIAPWPKFDPALVAENTVTYAVQVLGKLRSELQAPIAATEAEVRALAEADPKVKPWLEGKTVKKFVFVPKRLVNFVVG